MSQELKNNLPAYSSHKSAKAVCFVAMVQNASVNADTLKTTTRLKTI